MAFRLTKAEDARKTEYETELEQLVGSVTDAQDELREQITKLVDDFNEKYVNPLNEKLEEVRGFVEDIHSERQTDFDGKSERWQEGERGQAAQDWLQEWENGMGDLEDMPLLEAPDVGLDIPDAANVLAGLPFEAAE